MYNFMSSKIENQTNETHLIKNNFIHHEVLKKN